MVLWRLTDLTQTTDEMRATTRARPCVSTVERRPSRRSPTAAFERHMNNEHPRPPLTHTLGPASHYKAKYKYTFLKVLEDCGNQVDEMATISPEDGSQEV